MRLQLYQSYSFTATGLKSGKMSINWISVGIIGTYIEMISVGIIEFKVTLKLKLETLNGVQINITY